MSERSPEMRAAFEAHMDAAEKIATREDNEQIIGFVMDRLRESGYFKESDVIEEAFPDPATLKAWLSKGELPSGMGKAVARYDVTSVIADVVPAGVLQEGAGKDKFFMELEAHGYKVVVDPNFDKMDGEHDSVSYMVYEQTLEEHREKMRSQAIYDEAHAVAEELRKNYKAGTHDKYGIPIEDKDKE